MILPNSVSQFLYIGPIGKGLAHNRICFSFAKVLFSSLNFTCISFKKSSRTRFMCKNEFFQNLRTKTIVYPFFTLSV